LYIALDAVDIKGKWLGVDLRSCGSAIKRFGMEYFETRVVVIKEAPESNTDIKEE
jgi:hypothetical protein